LDLKHSAAEIWLLGPGLRNLANNNVLARTPLPPDKRESRSCFPPNRSTTCIACTGPSTGRSARSHSICAWAGTPSAST
jgi:hypothetical protein